MLLSSVCSLVPILCHIYTFARVARQMTSVTITYSPHHLLRHSPHHSWRLLWKRFFEHESKGTNGDSPYVYEHVNVCTHVKTVFFAQRQRHTNVRASDDSSHEHECVNAVLKSVRGKSFTSFGLHFFQKRE